MKYFKLALLGLIILLASAFVQKSLNNDLTNGLAKTWEIAYVIINDVEMTANEIPDLACLKKNTYTFYNNNNFYADTACHGLNYVHSVAPYTILNDTLMILDGDTMQLVELNSFKLKLRRKIPVEGDSVTLSPETAFVNLDLILSPVTNSNSGGR